MKRRFWIGGVLLLMFFTGMTGCGGPKEPPPEHMLDGPDMMYTPEDQTPYAGTWQSRDGTIVMKVERGGGAESESDMSLSVNGEPEFEAKMWVYSTGQVELLRGSETARECLNRKRAMTFEKTSTAIMETHAQETNFSIFSNIWILLIQCRKRHRRLRHIGPSAQPLHHLPRP